MGRTKEAGYPQWICHGCGEAYGSWYKRGNYIGPPHHCATYHQGSCDLCGALDVLVTEPRDYGHLKASWRRDLLKDQVSS